MKVEIERAGYKKPVTFMSDMKLGQIGVVKSNDAHNGLIIMRIQNQCLILNPELVSTPQADYFYESEGHLYTVDILLPGTVVKLTCI